LHRYAASLTWQFSALQPFRGDNFQHLRRKKYRARFGLALWRALLAAPDMALRQHRPTDAVKIDAGKTSGESQDKRARYIQSLEGEKYFPSLRTLTRLRVALRCYCLVSQPFCIC
jgi:hypothetical protein